MLAVGIAVLVKGGKMEIIMGGRLKGVNKAAFQGEMNCPFCSIKADPSASIIGFETSKSNIKCLGNVGPFMREYKCMSCGGVWRYDIARQYSNNPYSSFKRGLKLPGLGYEGKVRLIGK